MAAPELNHRGAAPTIASLPYQDVPPDDFDNDEEENLSPTRRRHRSRAPPTTVTSSGGGVQYCLFYILFALVVTAVALLVMRQTSKPAVASTSSIHSSNKNDDLIDTVSKQSHSDSHKKGVIYYDSSVALHPMNPFDLHETDSTVLVAPPVVPSIHDEPEDDFSLGYMMQPNIVNNTLLFISEGDLYLTNIVAKQNTGMPAMKLTTTVGNVRTPTNESSLSSSHCVYSHVYWTTRSVHYGFAQIHHHNETHVLESCRMAFPVLLDGKTMG